jgi:hypothetical protein
MFKEKAIQVYLKKGYEEGGINRINYLFENVFWVIVL